MGAMPVFSGRNNFMATGAFEGEFPENQIKNA
jgi:hypothetical protein